MEADQDARIVDSGNLLCMLCERRYPIKNGIVHFIDPQELEGSNLRFARFYDRVAPAYSIFSKAALLPFGGERKARSEILHRLDLNQGRILEVSIGNGVNLPHLFELPDAGEVFGVDISIGLLRRCRSLLNRRGWLADLFLAMAEALPFREDAFDTVFHIGGINFFSGKKQAIDEMIRVARPGSKIVIADEAERFARRVAPSVSPLTDGGDGPGGTSLINLVPSTMEDIEVDGIWRAHGKFHGYCLHFRKPA